MTTARHTPEGQIDVDALFAQALADHRAGRLAEAAAGYRQILALRPDLAEVHSNLGTLLWHAQQVDEAVAEFQQALALKPDLADAYGKLAGVLRERSEQAAIAAGFEQTLATAHGKLGIELRQQSRFDEAAARFEQALALAPRWPEAHYNLGATRWLAGQVRRRGGVLSASHRFKAGLCRGAGRTGPHAARTIPAGRSGASLPAAALRRARLAQRSIGPGHLLFAPGGLPARLAGVRGAAADCRARPLPDIPRWQGEDLTGRSLLVVAEAGFGDTLHFLRYARLLKARGARVVFAVQPSLGRLLASHPDIDELCLLDSGQELPRCDFCLSMLSLPGAFQTTAATIPREVPYLWADPALEDHWRRELAKIEGFKIGIVWQGSRVYVSNHWRSIPLAQFAPLAAQSGVRLISLQKGMDRSKPPQSTFRYSTFPAGSMNRPARSWTPRR